VTGEGPPQIQVRGKKGEEYYFGRGESRRATPSSAFLPNRERGGGANLPREKKNYFWLTKKNPVREKEKKAFSSDAEGRFLDRGGYAQSPGGKKSSNTEREEKKKPLPRNSL